MDLLLHGNVSRLLGGNEMRSLVTYETVDDVALVDPRPPRIAERLDRGDGRSAGQALLRAITEDVGAAVLAGNGRAFCAGHDLNEVQDPAQRSANRRELERIQDVTRLLMRSPHPVVAAIQGYALGAGLEFALGCDLVVAARGTQLGFPEVGGGSERDRGGHPHPAAGRGPRGGEGDDPAGRAIPAERAQALGLVNAVVEADELMATALGVRAALAARPRESLRSAKRSLDLGLHGGLEAVLQREIEDALGLVAVDQGATGSDLFRARAAGPMMIERGRR